MRWAKFVKTYFELKCPVCEKRLNPREGLIIE